MIKNETVQCPSFNDETRKADLAIAIEAGLKSLRDGTALTWAHRETLEAFAGECAWTKGFAFALAEMYRQMPLGQVPRLICAIAASAGVDLETLQNAKVRSIDVDLLRRAGLPSHLLCDMNYAEGARCARARDHEGRCSQIAEKSRSDKL